MIEINRTDIKLPDVVDKYRPLLIATDDDKIIITSHSGEVFYGNFNKDEIQSLIQSLQYFVDNGIFRDI